MKKRFNMKNFKFYFEAFISIFCLESCTAIVLSFILSLVANIITDSFMFWYVWGVLEIVCLIDALYLTFTTKNDPWGKG